jgi:hypothetical protein
MPNASSPFSQKLQRDKNGRERLIESYKEAHHFIQGAVAVLLEHTNKSIRKTYEE